jgi:valyl-tRNA synthetase
MTDTQRPSLDGLEQRWGHRWQEEGTYAFDRSADRADVYAIDTPPPTVSGALHVGHCFSYTHTDVTARYRRMRGKAVFYPMGWDDNGLPTERMVQYRYGVSCDPSLPYDPDFTPPAAPADPPVPISRRNFTELCARVTAEEERRFEALWRTLGLSVDWSQTYTTIGPAARAAAQRAFLRNLARGEAYAAQAPTLWDVTFRTAVAQAELEERELPGAYHRLRFGDRVVETTRPELLPACVALVCHPSDERYAALVGTTVPAPLFGVDVPVRAHPLARPDKGTGLAMVCTFGDLTDVTWWRELDLPTRPVLGRDGRLLPAPPPGVAAGPYAELAGLPAASARRRIVALLRDAGALDGEPRRITHPVKFYEKGDAPLEIVTSRQWYLRNGGRGAELRARLLDLGREVRWVPGHMHSRYEHWVTGLNGDWLVSRQRFFGVPIPLWYRLDAAGDPDHDAPLTPAEERLPVDPASQCPAGYDESMRDRPGGFTADPDVLDTWATSSLTPLIVSGWERDPELFAKVFPMDLRPQAHEIIRTWLFSSVLRADAELGTLPWHTAVISGWILDPDRKKIAKSKANADEGRGPHALIDRYGADAVRYWAASGRPGVDLAFDEQQMKVGRRLATKLLNASRFVLGLGGGGGDGGGGAGDGQAPVTEALDRSMLAALSAVVGAATAALESYDHTGALDAVERFFWRFCDDHVELVKERAYGTGPGAASARTALRTALGVQLRLFAPFLPYVTEEVWSWWRDGSVHRAPWPTSTELDAGGEPALLDLAGEALGQVRRAKSDRRMSLRTELAAAEVSGAGLELLAAAAADLRAAGRIGRLVLRPGGTEPLTVTCTF